MPVLSGGGAFEYRGDTDWHRVRLTAGTNYVINLSGGSGNGMIYLILPDGTRFHPTIEYTNVIQFVAPVTGDYFVAADTFAGSGGVAYSITVQDLVDLIPASIATTYTLGVGSSATQNYSFAVTYDDWYGVTLTAGQSYLLDSNNITDRVYFLDATGSVAAIEGNGSGGQRAHFTPVTGGTYYVGILTNNTNYTLSLNAVTDDYGASTSLAGNLAVGTPTTGTLETFGDDDWFAVNLTAGQSYKFLMDTGVDSTSGKYIQVRDASGALLLQPVNYSISSPEAIFTAATSGTYYVSASIGAGGGPAISYTLSATAITDLADNVSTTGTLAVGGSTAGTWQGQGDRDWYAISLTAGTSYNVGITLSSNPGFNGPVLAIYDSSGALVPMNTGNWATGAITHFTALTTGTYYVSAAAIPYSSGTVPYTVTASITADDLANNIATTGTIAVGGTATGTSDANWDADWFAVTLTAGVNYRIDSPDQNSAVAIRNAAGQLLTYGIWGDEVFSPTASGTYYLEAMGYGGAYTVRITTIAGDLTENNTTSSVLRENIAGTTGPDSFDGVSQQHEAFSGGDGNDIFYAGAGYDLYSGGAGIDTISFANYTVGAQISLLFSFTTVGGVRRHTVTGIENVVGSDFDDTITGNSSANVIDGGAGADIIDGGAGINTLSGGSGNDRLILGASTSGSSIDGGANSDTLAINATVTSLAALVGIEALEFNGGSGLTLTGSQVANGLAGNATISGTGTLTVNMDVAGNFFSKLFNFVGSGVSLVVNGTSGADIFKLGNAGHTINAGDGTDQIKGGNLFDIIDGGDGADKINGAGGADILTGGTGNDVFKYANASDSGLGAAADRITDFVIGSDRLNFVEMDANAATPGDQAFAFVGIGAFSGGGVGSIRYQDSGTDLLVQVDVDGNGSADMEIILEGLAGQTLAGGSFNLGSTADGPSKGSDVPDVMDVLGGAKSAATPAPLTEIAPSAFETAQSAFFAETSTELQGLIRYYKDNNVMMGPLLII